MQCNGMSQDAGSPGNEKAEGVLTEMAGSSQIMRYGICWPESIKASNHGKKTTLKDDL